MNLTVIRIAAQAALLVWGNHTTLPVTQSAPPTGHILYRSVKFTAQAAPYYLASLCLTHVYYTEINDWKYMFCLCGSKVQFFILVTNAFASLLLNFSTPHCEGDCTWKGSCLFYIFLKKKQYFHCPFTFLWCLQSSCVVLFLSLKHCVTVLSSETFGSWCLP